jgi:hypothetical protein
MRKEQQPARTRAVLTTRLLRHRRRLRAGASHGAGNDACVRDAMGHVYDWRRRCVAGWRALNPLAPPGIGGSAFATATVARTRPRLYQVATLVTWPDGAAE